MTVEQKKDIKGTFTKVVQQMETNGNKREGPLGVLPCSIIAGVQPGKKKS